MAMTYQIIVTGTGKGLSMVRHMGYEYPAPAE